MAVVCGTLTPATAFDRPLGVAARTIGLAELVLLAAFVGAVWWLEG